MIWRFKNISAIRLLLSVLVLGISAGCMKWEYGEEVEKIDIPASGLVICNEGNFQYGNATLSFYNPADNSVENELFYRANGFRLGDVAQSLTMQDDRLWVVVNNSHVVFAINPDTFKEIGRIENLTSPRFIHFVNDRKAYITQLWDNRITIVDPKRYEITGYITVPDMNTSSGSTEQMVQIGKYVYCTCWSYQNRIIRINSDTDEVDASLEVGIQPRSMVSDNRSRLWVLCDGGDATSPYGHEAPSLVVVDPGTMEVVRRFVFGAKDSVKDLVINAEGDCLYWINGGVWSMNTGDRYLPDAPVIPDRGTIYYSLTVSPWDGDIYVADAIDYQQQGLIYRYSAAGVLKNQFYAGVTPGAFCWK